MTDLKSYTLTKDEKKRIKEELDALKKHINSNTIKGVVMISFTDEGWGHAKFGVVPAAAINVALDQVRLELQIETLELAGKIKIVDKVDDATLH